MQETGLKICFNKHGTILQVSLMEQDNFFNGAWNSVTSIFSNIGGWFRDRFQEAWNNIVSIFSGIGNFFGGLWNTIKDKFSSLGTTIGDAIGGAVKAGINGIIGMIENVINKGIDMINGAINLINNIPRSQYRKF